MVPAAAGGHTTAVVVRYVFVIPDSPNSPANFAVSRRYMVSVLELVCSSLQYARHDGRRTRVFARLMDY